jgi:hypothetical protein
MFRANQSMETRPPAARRNPRPGRIPPDSRPKTKVEHHIQAEFEASRPDLLDLLTNPPIEILEILDRRIIAVEARHPFIVREPDRRKPPFEPPSELVFPTPRNP